MRDSFTKLPPWTYPLLTISLGPLAAYLGVLWGWTPGAASLAVLALPVGAAALTGDRALAVTSALLAAACGFIECIFARAPLDGELRLIFPLLGAALLPAAAALIALAVGRLRDRVRHLETQNAQFVRELYQRTRENDAIDDETIAPDEAAARLVREETGGDGVNFALMLVTIQDVGRRISLNLDLDSLIPTIIGTAKTSLRCRECHVYFWTSRERALRNPLPARSRDVMRYVPRADAGMAQWVLEQRQILTRRMVEDDYTFRTLAEEDPDLPAAIAPLSVGGELLGLLVVDGVEHETPTFARLLYILSDLYALGIKNAQLFKRIEDMARRDGLTGLLNHASFQEELERLVEQAAAGGGRLSVVMSDVDYFKKFNDTYGHQAGDHVLREVARLWRAILPEPAIVARYGGEEFIAALPGQLLPEAAELAEQLRSTLADYTLDFEGRPMNVSASFGVVEFGPSTSTAQELVRLADEGLYAAKSKGRNRVVAIEPPMADAILGEGI